MANNEFNIEKELRAILNEELPTAAIAEAIPARTPRKILLKRILALCKIFTNKVEVQRQGRTRSYLINNRDSFSDEEYQTYMVYGAQLIFLIRQNLMNENIDYYFTGRHANALIPEKEVLSNLTLIGQEAIGLTYALENKLIEKNKKRQMDQSTMAQWQKVLQLASPYPAWDHGADDTLGNGHKMYSKNAADKNVYVVWTEGKARVKNTYYKNDGRMVLFNEGWLWEWFLDKYYNTENFTITNSLQPLFKGNKMDNIRGTKQGDLRINGQWVQAKNKNEQIITVNAILEILYNLTKALEAYDIALDEGLSGGKEKRRLANLLNRYFIPKEVEGGQKQAREIANQLIEKLKVK